MPSHRPQELSSSSSSSPGHQVSHQPSRSPGPRRQNNTGSRAPAAGTVREAWPRSGESSRGVVQGRRVAHSMLCPGSPAVAHAVQTSSVEKAQAGTAHCRIPEKSLARVRQGQPCGRQSMSVLTAPQLWRCGRLHSDHARSPHLVPEPPVARGTAQTGLSQGLRRSDPKLPRGPSVLTGVLARGRREAQSQKVDEAALPAVTRGKEPRARDAAPLEAGEAGDASPGASGQPGPACTWVHPPRPVRDPNLRDCEK